jgi:hypothetical protein
MNFKKILFAIVIVLFVSVSGFSQAENKENEGNKNKLGSIGIIGSYGIFMPSSWSVGLMSEFFGVRMGISYGQMTVTFEKENLYSSTHKLTEYWQKSFYMDFIGGYVYQINLGNIIGLRVGGDIIFSISPAYEDTNDGYSGSFLELCNWAFTGIVGIKLFPNGDYYISIDACPGYSTFISAMDKGAFIMPIRLGVGVNF